jgi:hypothetical protein
MFERISFRHQSRNPREPVDIGLLLECMIFYGKVSVIADHNTLKQLISQLGFDILHDLLDANALEIIYTETQTGIVSSPNANGIPVYDTVLMSSPQHTFHKRIVKCCQELTNKEGKGRRHALRLEKKIRVSNHDISVMESGKQLLLDNRFLAEAICLLINEAIPQIKISASDIEFATEAVETGILVHSNLNFDKLNRLYHVNVSPADSSLSEALLLAHVFNVECDLYFAARQLSEIATSPVSSALIAKRFSHLARRCEKSIQNKDSFQEFVFKGNRTIRESYNSGEIAISEIVKIILKADRFKQWLDGKEIDSNLLFEYYKEVTNETLVNKLPIRYVRWAVFTGAGIALDLAVGGGAGTLAGVALSAFDGLILDNIARGWKPNQFVEKRLQHLLN